MAHIVYPLMVYYDGACELCRSQMRKIQSQDKHNRLILQDITDADFFPEDQGFEKGELHRFLYVKDSKGATRKGVDAFVWIWRTTDHRWKAVFFEIMGVNFVAKIFYKIISSFRYSFNQTKGGNVCRGKCAWKGY